MTRPVRPGDPDRKALAIAGDDDANVKAVAELVDALGCGRGPLAEGVRFEPSTELFGSDADAAEVQAMLDPVDAESSLHARARKPTATSRRPNPSRARGASPAVGVA